MYQYEFLSTSPIAMSWVIDEIDVGMLYTNVKGLVVDQNRYLMDQSWDIDSVIFKNPVWSSAITNLMDTETEIFEHDKYFHIKVHHLKIGGAVSLIRDITRDKIKEQELTHRAETDRMTKILNRESFISKAQNLLDNNGDNASVIIIDIDYFKAINDTYGHMAGDYVIQTIVNILKSSLRDGDLVGRLGGDEFIIFVNQCTTEQIGVLTSRILESVQSFIFTFDNKLLKTSLSMGCVVSSNKNFNELYKMADDALYEAKESGRNRAVIR
jgi:diguanylate cyclase (GGDEF)-like protein